MFRTLLYLIITVAVISLLRGVIGILASLFTNAAVGPERRQSKESLKPEALLKDPVCGTFVAPSTAVRKDRDGQTYYFCSAACRDRF